MLCLAAGYIRARKDTKLSGPVSSVDMRWAANAAVTRNELSDLRSFWPENPRLLGSCSR